MWAYSVHTAQENVQGCALTHDIKNLLKCLWKGSPIIWKYDMASKFVTDTAQKMSSDKIESMNTCIKTQARNTNSRAVDFEAKVLYQVHTYVHADYQCTQSYSTLHTHISPHTHISKVKKHKWYSQNVNPPTSKEITSLPLPILLHPLITHPYNCRVVQTCSHAHVWVPCIPFN